MKLTLWRGSLEVRPDDFISWSVGARFYPLLYVLTRVTAARDLQNGLLLSHGMLGYQSRLHVHHIFPKKRLYDAGDTRPQVNALANFCLLTAESNWDIGAGHPAEYFAKAEARHPGVLRSQWIPDDPDLWSIDRYPSSWPSGAACWQQQRTNCSMPSTLAVKQLARRSPNQRLDPQPFGLRAPLRMTTRKTSATSWRCENWRAGSE